MSATITTQHNNRVPLATALAAAGVLIAAGAVGVAVQKSHSDAAPVQATGHVTTLQDYVNFKNSQLAEGTPHKGTAGSLSNSRSIEARMKFPTPPTNARSAEAPQPQQPQIWSGGKLQTGE